jgi:hypothetical protein
MLPPTSTLPPTTSHLLQTTFRLPIEEIIVPQCRGCRGTPPVGVLDAALWVWYGGIVTDGKAVVLPHHPSSLSSSKTGWCKRYLYHPFLLLTASSFSSHTLKCRSPPSSHSKSPIAFFSISHKKGITMSTKSSSTTSELPMSILFISPLPVLLSCRQASLCLDVNVLFIPRVWQGAGRAIIPDATISGHYSALPVFHRRPPVSPEGQAAHLRARLGFDHLAGCWRWKVGISLISRVTCNRLLRQEQRNRHHAEALSQSNPDAG